jgi:uncharacterized protein (DUF488 family)
MLATIGYEKAQLEHFIGTLQYAGIDVLIDIRDRAQSRRKGFSKTALSNRLTDAGIQYLHFRNLGDPKEGREAARSGDMVRFRRIFGQVMAGSEAQSDLAKIVDLAQNKVVCLLCYERDHKHCHRKIVAEELETTLGVKAKHLGVQAFEPVEKSKGRLLHRRQSVAA